MKNKNVTTDITVYTDFCHSHENGNPVSYFLDSRLRLPAMLRIVLQAGGNDNKAGLA